MVSQTGHFHNPWDHIKIDKMFDLEYLKYTCIRTVVNTSLYVRRSSWMSPSTQPDRVKTYSCRPNLFACRIFTPRDHEGKDRLPLVIRAHGGGFVVNNPAADDPMARHIADHSHCIVVSIDYSKAPQNKFPTAYEDVIAQVLAIIDDEELPVDKSKVVLCGSSAGSNLQLGAAQDARLCSKLLGIIGIYPGVDLREAADAKMATRPDPTLPDFIGDGLSDLVRVYLDPAHMPSLTDVRLSPLYFTKRQSLPAHVLLVGAEHDMFCHEAEVMVDKLVSLSGGEKCETQSGWKAEGVQWYKVADQPHAFDNFPAKMREKEAARVAAVDAMYSLISEWLVDVFARKSVN